MGLIEKWNLLAKKRIYISESIEIPVGRLIFSGIIVALEAIPILIATQDWGLASVTLISFLLSFKKS